MTATKQAVQPAEKKRSEILRDMTPAGRKMAEDFEKILGKGAKGIVLLQYDMGAKLSNAIENEAEYGNRFVEQLADYLPISGGAASFYNLRNFADAFEREYVEAESAVARSDGSFLELGHWLRLSQLKDKSDVKGYIKRIRANNLSVRELSREIAAAGTKLKNTRQGGRKPGVPTSPLAGLQQTFSIAQKFTNLEPVLNEAVFDAIDHMPPAEVSDDLLAKLETTEQQLGLMSKACDKAIKHVTHNIERVKRVLKDRPPEEKAAAKPKAKAPKKKPAAKAKAKGAKKKTAKKPARKRPQIQTVE